MRYIPHTEDDIREMLAGIGVGSVAELFDDLPDAVRRNAELDVPPAASELEVQRELEALANRTGHAALPDRFLGAGAYPHFVPSVVDAIASRSEFYTAYTPYQPEISQGTLQVIFEWQSMLCGLTGCDVANASMYDGASAAAEAALMAMRVTGRKRVLVSAALHPHYRQVLDTYLGGLGANVETLAIGDGRTALPESLSDEPACVLIQQPNFVGCAEDLSAWAERAHESGALLVAVVSEALSLAFFRPPGRQGADIVCGEAQSFGVPVSFGGPHLGFLATAKRHVRQLPGRLVGETLDTRGKRGFVLTLATREQHIRRERATSNICTNQGLCLLMATVYLALHGPKGLRALALRNYHNARYARERVAESTGADLVFAAPGFNEFALRTRAPVAAVLERAREAGILAGLDLAPYAPRLSPTAQLDNAMLSCVTELADRAAIDRWIAVLETA
ncbi:MAG: aminomethyl-transferring glycine dehydrogenase subunit GcvPA [Myxococcales bacterium]|nr:aminomethyl-transferring glycine dehydrogenase subunit GcvPA [Myxococcales bacterium]